MSNTKEEKQWPSGVLNQEVIAKDMKRGTLPKAIALSVAAVGLGFALWPMLMASTDINVKTIAFLVGTGILVVLAYRQWCGVLTKLDYRVEEDRIISKQMQTIYEDRDAEATGMATRVPMLELEKHGSYRIVADHIHGDYREYELYHMLEEGEQLYLVYNKKNNKLLHIYRQKYWTME